MTQTQTIKAIPQHVLEMAFDEYDEDKTILGILSNRLKVSPNKFLQMYNYHLDVKEKFNGSPANDLTAAPIIGKFPVMAEKLKGLKVSGKKQRVVLNEEQRALAYEAIAAGATNGALAIRFNVSKATITNIRNEYRAMKREQKEVKPETPPPLEDPAPLVLEKISLPQELEVSFEGDYLLIKIPKKHITRQLLKDLL